MENWRELARSVPRTLMLVVDGATTELLISLIDRAHGRLQQVINMVLDLRRGLTVHPRPSDEQCPGEDLDEACDELGRLCTLHTAAGQLFVLCGSYLGLWSSPLRQRAWEDRRTAVASHAAVARRWLRSAAEHARAACASDRMAGSFLRRSPGWEAWVLGSLKHARCSIWMEMMARAEVRRMRHAVILEFFDVWMILNQCESVASAPSVRALQPE